MNANLFEPGKNSATTAQRNIAVLCRVWSANSGSDSITILGGKDESYIDGGFGTFAYTILYVTRDLKHFQEHGDTNQPGR